MLDEAPEPVRTSGEGPGDGNLGRNWYNIVNYFILVAPDRIRISPLLSFFVIFSKMLQQIESRRREPRTGVLTVVALTAFSANSIFCRLALSHGTIHPALFTAIRLGSGALVLLLLCSVGGKKIRFNEKWGSGLLLLLYAATFTYAYTDLSAGTGALILFASVQITMIASSILGGHRPSGPEWAGLILAFAGLVYLLSPGLAAPSLTGSLLMIVAGAAWGLYTVLGKNSDSPLADTAGNFLRASVPALALSVIAGTGFSGGVRAAVDTAGAGYALASGVLASGIGYAVWYAALRGLTSVRAAVVQLAVPVITAAAGVAILSEEATIRLLAASLTILGGIAIAIAGRRGTARGTISR